MAIATSTFLQDTILFLRNHLRTNVTDPISRSSGIGFVMTSYPKREVQYPIITIKNTGMNTRKLGIGSEVVWIDMTIEIRVWGRNAKECDDLTQDTINSLRSAQYGTGGTDEEEIFGFTLLSSNSVVESEGDNSIHSKVMSYSYKAILS